MVALEKTSPAKIAKDPVGYELAWLDVLIKEAWSMYLGFGGEVTDEEEVEQYDSEGNLTGTSKKKKTRNDPKIAMALFDRVMRLHDKRRDLMGVKGGDIEFLEIKPSSSSDNDGAGYTQHWPSPKENENGE